MRSSLFTDRVLEAVGDLSDAKDESRGVLVQAGAHLYSVQYRVHSTVNCTVHCTVHSTVYCTVNGIVIVYTFLSSVYCILQCTL